MEGGIRAWKGLVATGGPEAGSAYFTAAENFRDLVALAWGLEEGTRRFYQGLRKQLADEPETRQLLSNLMEAENRHKQDLLAAFKRSVGQEASTDDLQAGFGEITAGEIMEGGVPVREALAWSSEQETRNILEFALGLEINSYDLYIKMSRKTDGIQEKQLFRNLAREEQKHLERLGSLLNNYLRAYA